MTAADMARQVRKLARELPYEAVSIGYPGLVLRGRIAAEPFNLGPGWVGYDFEKAFGRPVRVINDATMQALGSYEGGRMLFLGLGTGLGATLIIDGTVEPMEIGHMPYKSGRTFEDYVGEGGRERLGNKKWRKACGGSGRAAQDGARGRLRRVGRRECRAPEGAARGRAPRRQPATPSRAAWVCGAATSRSPPASRGRQRGGVTAAVPPMSGSNAPGAPGLPPTWSSSAKEMVGCSLGPSRLWFTIGGGILNEVYYPRIDIPQIRDLGFIVADGRGFWVEVKRMYRHSLELAGAGRAGGAHRAPARALRAHAAHRALRPNATCC